MSQEPPSAEALRLVEAIAISRNYPGWPHKAAQTLDAFAAQAVAAAYARYAKDHKDLVAVMYEERAAKVAEARREGEIAGWDKAVAAYWATGALPAKPDGQ